MSSPLKLFRQLVDEPKLQKKPRKKFYIENKAEYDTFVKVKTLNKSLIKFKNPQN